MPDWLKDIVPALGIVVMATGTLVVPVLSWVVRRGLVSQDDLRETLAPVQAGVADLAARLQRIEGDVRHMPAADDIADLTERTQRLEADIRHLPTADDVAALRETLARLEGGIGGLSDEQKRQGRALERMEEYLTRRPEK
ncbi:hypothetical protein [Tistrella mobilis]|uniref:DUF2730 domain-containing protein n=1 Tax=Tistrella mobilis (strain KA081020-065) TaxID=1110502 RepID=I3TN86_TISMK|nr:hypothetical protein [Tistrella mobilis]AFK54224.1 hypothetical protein TMO_2386 [Tistrella mobilis KA081020-065]